MSNYPNEEENSYEQEPEQFDKEFAEPKLARTFVVPDSKVKLLACEKCRLIKTESQWKSSGSCENCKHFSRETDYKKFTSSRFEGMVALMDTNHSWLRRKLVLGKNNVAGIYAVELH